jgi:hypothetical protein
MRKLFSRAPACCTLLLLVLLVGCSGARHRLAQYDFSGRTLALLAFDAPAPELLTPGLNLGRNPLATAMSVGTRAAVETQGREAQARLDSAATRVDLSARIHERTLERAGAYLGARPVPNREGADFLMEVNIQSVAIDARSSQATLVVGAESTLLDAQTGREIWRAHVRSREPLTTRVRTGDRAANQVLSAAMLKDVSVEEFEEILQRTADRAADWITGQLREDLRQVRR